MKYTIKERILAFIRREPLGLRGSELAKAAQAMIDSEERR